MIGIDNKKILWVVRETEYGPVLHEARMTLLEFAEWYSSIKAGGRFRIIPNGVNGFIATNEDWYILVELM